MIREYNPIKLIFQDGTVYEGEVKFIKFHGQGVLTKFHGQGVLTYPDGSRYKGQWKHGKKHGEGTCFWAGGSKYEGEWKGGKKHGEGTYSWADGNTYKGEWKDDHIMLQSEKTKKQNKTPTLLLRSPEINSQNNSLRYETHKFLEGGEDVKVAVCKNEKELFKEICKFSESNKNKDRCRIVFSQQGNSGGINNMNITKDFARMMLAKLANDGIKNITISDEAPHGGTAYHFIKVAQNVANIYEVNIKLRYALEGRSCVSGLKWNNEDSRFTEVAFGIDGLATPREKMEFRPQSSVVNNSGCKKLVSANRGQLR